MTERCKACGQKLPPKHLPDGVYLTDTQRRIWEACTRYPGKNIWEMMDFVYGHNGDRAPTSSNIISVNIHIMNKRLAPYGMSIRGHRSLGYRIYKREKNDAVAA